MPENRSRRGALPSPFDLCSARRELEAGARIAHLGRIEGQDGKSYPARPTSILVPNPREARVAQERLIFLGEAASPGATMGGFVCLLLAWRRATLTGNDHAA
jgi:hypothetical protein